MTDYSISLGIILEQDDLQRIRTQLNRLELDPITIKLDTSQIQSQIDNIRTQIKNIGNIGVNLGSAVGGVGGVTNGMRNLAKGANDVNRAYRELISLQNRMGSKQQVVAKLDTTHNQREIIELSNQIDNLHGRYQRLYNLFAGQFSTTQVDALNRNFQITSERLDVVNRKIADTKAKLASGIQANFGNYEAQIVSLEGKFAKLAVQPKEIRVGLDALKQALTTLKTADGTDAIITANQNYLAILKQVQSQLKLNAATEQQDNNAVALNQARQNLALKMSNWLRDNSAAAKRFGGEIRNLQVQLNNCGNIKGVQQIGRAFQNITLQARQAGLSTLSFGDRLKKQFASYSAYFSAASVFMYAIRGLRSMFEQVKSIDSAMTELKKVTNETDEAYNRFLTNAASRSKEIGTTIDGLVSSTADFARLGYSFKDAQGLAEVANIYAVVGDEIEGVEGATKSLISTMAAFKDSINGMSNSEFAMSIVDKFNEIGKLIA